MLPQENQKPILFEDTKTPYWMLSKNGYYVVGSKYFAHKMNALIEATRSGNDLRWEFGSDIFGKFNWRQPIQTSISDLYRMRAQQLRDKYDYLILAFSGGADSCNVLDSFLCNNIHLDEIFVHWPRNLTQGTYQVSRNTNTYNILSEWELAVVPKLEEVRKNYPNVKITIDDLSDLSEEYSEDAVSITKNKFHYLNIKRQRGMARRSSQVLQTKSSVATIYGFDKPRLINVNNVICAYFVDEMTSVVSEVADGYERNIEFFYWAVDLPELPIKQSQVLYEFFRQRPDLQPHMDSKPLHNIDNQKYADSQVVNNLEIYREITSRLLYPTWKTETFQAAKPSYFAFKCEHHAWINQYNESKRLIDSWTSAFNQFHKLVDSKFLLSDDGLYRSFSTKLYPLGTL